jgi:excisionase family DNA binding protein
MKHSERITRRLLTIDETAEYLGLAPTTLYKMVSQRRLPFVKVGRLLRFDSRLIDEWLQAHTVMPMPERRS